MNQEDFFPHRRGNLAAAMVVITTVTVPVSTHKEKIMNTIQGLILFSVRLNMLSGKTQILWQQWKASSSHGVPRQGGKSVRPSDCQTEQAGRWNTE